MRSSHLITRRHALVGVSSFAIITSVSPPASAALPAWYAAVGAGIISGWMVEALKNWGLVPQSLQATGPDVQNHHNIGTAELQREGLQTKPLYSGPYSTGEIKVTQATSGDHLRTLATSAHGSNTCSLKFDNVDTATVGFVAAAMRKRGLNPIEAQAASMPIHTDGGGRFDGSVRTSDTFVTPSHGTVTWNSDFNRANPNMTASVRSPLINTDVYVWNDGQWRMQMA